MLMPTLTTNKGDTIRNVLNPEERAANAKQFLEYVNAKIKESTVKFREASKTEGQDISKTFNVISQRISDTLHEASTSSFFDKRDKIKIMRFIDIAIEEASLSDKERRVLIAQNKTAIEALKKSRTKEIEGNLKEYTLDAVTFPLKEVADTMTATVNELPQFWSSLFTHTGSLLAKATGSAFKGVKSWFTDKKETPKDSVLQSIQNDIKTDKTHSATTKAKRERTLERIKPDNQVIEEVPEQPQRLEKTSTKSDFAKSKVERIQSASGSLLDRAPSGSRDDPVYIDFADKIGILKAQKPKEQTGLIGALTGALGKFLSPMKFLRVLPGIGKGITVLADLADLAGTLSGLLESGVGKLFGLSDNSEPLSDEELPADKELPDFSDFPDIPDKSKSAMERTNAPKKESGKAEKKNPARLGKAGGILAKGIPVIANLTGVGEVLKEGNDLVNEKLQETNEERAKLGMPPIEQDFAKLVPTDDEDEMDAALRVGRETQSKFERQQKDPGILQASKESPRAPISTQVDLAEKTRQNVEQKKQEMTLNQQNHNNIVTLYNNNTTNQTNRIIQINNPQANLVHGTR